MTSIALPRPLSLSDAQIYRARYLIAFAVVLASVLELVDTSIVNVAIPHMMGNLGATLDEISWVSTGYIIANVVVIPMSSWLSGYFGRKRYLTGSIMTSPKSWNLGCSGCRTFRTCDATISPVVDPVKKRNWSNWCEPMSTRMPP